MCTRSSGSPLSICFWQMGSYGFLKRLELLTALVLVSVAAVSAACVASDASALLAFKAGLYDSYNQLVSWNESNDCCTFSGVTCNPSGQVTQVLVDRFEDDDCEDDCPIIRSKSGVAGSENLVGTTLSKLPALEYLNLTNVYLLDVFPNGLGVLKKLKSLALIYTQLHGALSDDLSKVTTLQTLSVVGNDDITGPIPVSYCSLTNLMTLQISYFDYSSTRASAVPSCIGSLQALEYVDLEYSGLSGPFPAGLLQLHKVVSLRLTGNQLTGSIPAIGTGTWPSLQELYLETNNFTGAIPVSIGNLEQLMDLRLGATSDYSGFHGATKFSGGLPTTLGNLKQLEILYVRDAGLTGAIPTSLGQLSLLTDLELDSNQLTGTIPDSLLNTNLTILNLSDNQLTGSLPAALGNLKTLNSLNVARNKLSGAIPESFTKLTLSLFDASSNQLSGSIPRDLGKALTYGQLYLSNNLLTGTLYKDNLFYLNQLYLDNNLLTSLAPGSFPNDGSYSNLQTLDVHSNNLQGAIPSWVFQLNGAFTIDVSVNKLTSLPTDIDGTRLTVSYLNLSSNAIVGPIPTAFAQITGLNVIDLSKNKFSGSIPRSFTTNQQFMNIINFGENSLTGTIPENIFSSSFFNVLILNKNQLTGTIPPRIPNNDFLNYVDLSDNQLTGTINKTLLDGAPFLTKVKLDNNQFTGPIPDFSGACSGNLDTLSFSKNKLTGPVVPAAVNLKNCNTLKVYDVGHNQLTGTIPWAAFSSLKTLLVLGLGGNKLTGTISAALGNNIPSLVILDLSMNQLQGTVPWSSFSNGFKRLQIAGNSTAYSAGAPLYSSSIYFKQLASFIRTYDYTFSSTSAIILSKNSFTGTLSSAIGKLKGLHLLDVSSNKFSGALPSEIGTIPDLNFVNFSSNGFSGKIPATLSKFPASSFSNNPQLCGPPLSPCK